jgi:spore maturation protein A
MAMKELQQLEEQKCGESTTRRSGTGGRGIPAAPQDTASNEMCIFLIINISSLQLIPVNIIAYRSQYGSVNPAYIVGPAMAATAVSTLAGLIFCKLADRISCKQEAGSACKPMHQRKESGK